MEFRMTVTIAEHGLDDSAAERALDAFLELFPEAGPVVTQDTQSGALSVTMTLVGNSAFETVENGAGLFADGFNAAQLQVVPVLDVHIGEAGSAQEEELEFEYA